MLSLVFSPEIITWVILPVLIFLARVADVSLGTIRVLFISRGFKYLAPLIGFFEILIWLFAITQIMQNLNNAPSFFAYAFGFAFGTFVGMWIEEKISLGEVLIRIISSHNVPEMVSSLEANGYKITSVSAQSLKGEVKIILLVTHRKNAPNVLKLINSLNKEAFYTIEDLKSVSDESPQPNIFSLDTLKQMHLFKKGK